MHNITIVHEGEARVYYCIVYNEAKPSCIQFITNFSEWCNAIMHRLKAKTQAKTEIYCSIAFWSGWSDKRIYWDSCTVQPVNSFSRKNDHVPTQPPPLISNMCIYNSRDHQPCIWLVVRTSNPTRNIALCFTQRLVCQHRAFQVPSSNRKSRNLTVGQWTLFVGIPTRYPLPRAAANQSWSYIEYIIWWRVWHRPTNHCKHSVLFIFWHRFTVMHGQV